MHGPIERYDYSRSRSSDDVMAKAVLFLDYNEYHGAIHSETLEAFKSSHTLLTSYHRPGGRTLEKKLAESLGGTEDGIFLVSGADQALEEILNYSKTILNVKTYFSFHQTTYDHFYTFTKKYSLKGAEFESADLIYLCCPNNPDGLITSPEECQRLAAENLNKTFVFDFSYLKYSFETYESYFSSLQDLSNIFIVSSLAKLYPLAGLRSGWLFTSSSKAINFFDSYLNAKLTNPISRKVLNSCLDQKSFYDLQAQEIYSNRKNLAEVLIKNFQNQNIVSTLLSDLNLHGGNFFSLRFLKKEDLSRAIYTLEKAGVQVRHKAHWDFIRVTSVNDDVLKDIKERLLC